MVKDVFKCYDLRNEDVLCSGKGEAKEARSFRSLGFHCTGTEKP